MRVGILACLLGASGGDFVRSLRLPAGQSHEILGAWKVWEEQMSPLTTLTPFKKQILQAVCPQLSAHALEPCLVHGQALKERGLTGRKISLALEKIRRAQWKGKIHTEQEALSLIEK